MVNMIDVEIIPDFSFELASLKCLATPCVISKGRSTFNKLNKTIISSIKPYSEGDKYLV